VLVGGTIHDVDRLCHVICDFLFAVCVWMWATGQAAKVCLLCGGCGGGQVQIGNNSYDQ